MRSRAGWGVFTLRRITLTVVAWAVLWAFLTWLDLRPQPLGLLGMVALVAAAYAVCTAPTTPWLRPGWQPTGRAARTPARSDGRLRYLRRELESGINAPDARDTDLDAKRVQALLRDIACCRLADALALPVPPNQLRETLTHREPDLAAYLFADPAPRLRLTRLRDLVDRIEAL